MADLHVQVDRLNHRVAQLGSALRVTRLLLYVLILAQLVWALVGALVIAQIAGVHLSLGPDSRLATPIARQRPAQPPPKIAVEAPTPAITHPTPTPTAPTPVPAAEAPASPPRADLVTQGWSAISDGNLSLAERSFEQAVQASPRRAAAHHGLAYVLLQTHRSTEARGHLCTARDYAGKDIELAREISQLLQRNSLSCP